jgi:outer membrane receptor protein involved in Fe transport
MTSIKQLCTAILLFVVSNITAQDIKGRLSDKSDKAVSGATITLNRKIDSLTTKTAVSNNSGEFSFSNILKGEYFIRIRSLETGDTSLSVFSFDGNTDKILSIILGANLTKEMNTITVTGKKPLVEVKADKIIFNVEQSINSTGMDAVELLRRSPGVIVDQDENISIAGRNGVQIYIDGRLSPLRAQDLANFLRSIQSNMVESIEIINNPSSKYDAAGTGGIINIKHKKNKQFGTNGNLLGEYRLGVYSKYNAGGSLNHRNSKINVFSTYNYNNGISYNELDVYRRLSDSTFDQKTSTKSHTASHNFKGGVDYFLNDNHTIGAIVTITSSASDRALTSRTPIIYTPTGALDRILIANNQNNGLSNFKDIDLNYRFKDSLGHELNADLDYGMFDISNDQLQPNQFFDSTGKLPLYEQNFLIRTASQIKLLTGKLDYTQTLLKGTFTTGLKLINAKTDNSVGFDSQFGSGPYVPDSSRNNVFYYTETIRAAYGTYDRSFNKLSVNIGLRLENTSTNGRSLGYTEEGDKYEKFDTTFTRNYTDLFPALFLTYKLSQDFSWGASYSRRINRPSYNDLNPFESRLDAYSYFKGNPALRPEYANSFGLNMNWNFGLTTSFNYTHTKNGIVAVPDTLDGVKSFYGPRNLGTGDNYSVVFTYNLSKKWYTLFSNLTAFYVRNQADLESRPIDVKVKGASIMIQQNAKLTKKLSLDLTANYQSKFLWRGVVTADNLYSIDAGLQYNFHQGRSTLRVICTDFLKLWTFNGKAEFAGQYLRSMYQYEARQLKVSMNWRFGKTQFKMVKKTGNEESTNRALNNSQ